MRALYRLFQRLTFVMHLISGIILVAMMGTTLMDVMTRLLFRVSGETIDWTFIGSVEVTRYGLLLAILFTLPYALNHAQVIVDLFTEKLSQPLKDGLSCVYWLGFMLMGGAMCYRYCLSAEEVALTGETTQDLLIPMSYFYGLAAFAMGMLVIASLLAAICTLLGPDLAAEQGLAEGESIE